MAVRIYNTLSRRKEDLVPVKQGKVGMYSCGPTVYDYFHIGNARAFVVPDVIRRYLQYRGYEVTLVQNITDIDDKIIRRAAERGVTTDDVVSQYAEAFIDDRNALGIRAPDIQPRATEHVAGMIEMISHLIEKGLAYERNGDVYYDVSQFDDTVVRLTRISMTSWPAPAWMWVSPRTTLSTSHYGRRPSRGNRRGAVLGAPDGPVGTLNAA